MGGSSYRGYNNSKYMKEIQGKSILFRVSARFELGRVRVIESRLYKLISSWSISCTRHKSFRESCGWYPVKQVIFLFFSAGLRIVQKKQIKPWAIEHLEVAILMKENDV